jgi:hypothetical protein
MKKLFYIYLLILLGFTSTAQEVNVKAWFDTTRILIGDQVNYNIELNHNKGLNIIYPELNDTIAKGIEILESEGPDTISNTDENIRVMMKYLVTSFDTGFYEVRPVYAESQSSTGVLRYYSDYTALEVIRTNIAPADSTDVIFDIIGPRKAGITVMEVLPWVLLFLVLAAMSFFVYRYYGKRKAMVKEELSKLPDEPIHIIALREFDKLEKKELWQKSQHKEFYSVLTEILRTYIDRRYSIASLEMTSSETLQSLLNTGFKNRELYNVLQDILTRADLSKFAKFKPADEENIESLNNARHFVKMTYRRAEEETKSAPTEKTGKEDSDE